jgi:hypothetical protein
VGTTVRPLCVITLWLGVWWRMQSWTTELDVSLRHRVTTTYRGLIVVATFLWACSARYSMHERDWMKTWWRLTLNLLSMRTKKVGTWLFTVVGHFSMLSYPSAWYILSGFRPLISISTITANWDVRFKPVSVTRHHSQCGCHFQASLIYLHTIIDSQNPLLKMSKFVLSFIIMI